MSWNIPEGAAPDDPDPDLGPWWTVRRDVARDIDDPTPRSIMRDSTRVPRGANPTTKPDGSQPAGTRRSWFREPKTAVWMTMAAIVIIGGGRRLLWAWKAKAVVRLSNPDVTPEEIEAVAAFGRSGAWELLRIFSTTESEPLRTAAGRALARLWKDDELVAEEEKALVRRGFHANWHARRRYPRDLTGEIPIVVEYDVPFLPDNPTYVRAEDLEWSHRIVGADARPWRSSPRGKPAAVRSVSRSSPAISPRTAPTA